MALFERKTPDPRVIATRAICRGAVVMIALSIPLVAILKSPILPFLVIGGAAVGITSVWFFGRSKVVAAHSTEIDALEKAVEDLKDRLGDVEVRNRYEEALAEKVFEGEKTEAASGRAMGNVSESS